jgi:lipopolysaccharide export LptBFGC system permease protein LptF
VKTLHFYLLRQVIATMLMTALVFTFVLIVWSVLKELIPLLMTGLMPFSVLARALALLIPFVWVFAMPMGMLTATLLVFGRISADQELTAARASGVSLLSLITPVLFFSLALCGLSSFVNLQYGPLCRVAYNDLRSSLKLSVTDIRLPEGRPIKEFPGCIITIGRNRKDHLENVLIYQYENETNFLRTYHAETGKIETEGTNVMLHMFQVTGYDRQRDMPYTMGDLKYPLNLNFADRAMKEPAITDLTFPQLRNELKVLDQKIHLPLDLGKVETGTAAQKRAALKKQLNDFTEPIRVQLHREVAFSFACFGFTLIGIPLGIRMHRRETNIGVVIALGLVGVYYTLIIVAQSLSNRPELAPHLLMWLPNFIFQAAGAVLLWRANRGV